MTNEEAINNLYELKTYLLYHPIDFKGHISLPISLIDYSIESLKSQRTGYLKSILCIGGTPYSEKRLACSVCKQEYAIEDKKHIKFCVKCGAKMEEENKQ